MDQKIDFKNILAGIGTLVILLGALYVGVFSDASGGSGQKSGKASLSSNPLIYVVARLDPSSPPNQTVKTGQKNVVLGIYNFQTDNHVGLQEIFVPIIPTEKYSNVENWRVYDENGTSLSSILAVGERGLFVFVPWFELDTKKVRKLKVVADITKNASGSMQIRLDKVGGVQLDSGTVFYNESVLGIGTKANIIKILGTLPGDSSKNILKLP